MKLIRNSDISSLILAVPAGHRHLRLAVRLADGEDIVLHEAAVAAIVRAYASVKTHPVRQAVKLVSGTPAGIKEGFASHQLIESDVPDEDAAAELGRVLGM